MKWRSIQYSWPEAALFLFIVLFLFAGFIALYRYRQNRLAALADPHILAFIQKPRSSLFFLLKSFLFCMAWVFGVLALMQPKGNGHYPKSPLEENSKDLSHSRTVRQIAQDVIFMIDASASMAIADTSTGQPRLEEAKEVVEEVVSRLHGQNTALFAFTSVPMQIVPLTTDYLFTRLMLRQLAINEGETAGTDILLALTRVHELLNSASLKQTSVVLLTDGGDTNLESLQGSEREKYIEKIAATVQNVDAGQLRLYVIGIGSEQGEEVPNIIFKGHPVISALNEELLLQIAKAGKGELLLNRNMTTLQIADKILEGLKNTEQFQDKLSTSPRIQRSPEELVYDLYFQVPLGMAILALALALLLPETYTLNQNRINSGSIVISETRRVS